MYSCRVTLYTSRKKKKTRDVRKLKDIPCLLLSYFDWLLSFEAYERYYLNQINSIIKLLLLQLLMIVVKKKKKKLLLSDAIVIVVWDAL